MRRLNKSFVFVLSMVLVLSQILTPVMAKSSPRIETGKETETQESNELKIKKVDQFGNPVKDVEFTVEKQAEDPDPEAEDPDPEAEDPEAEEPPAEDPEAEEPPAEDPEAEEEELGVGNGEGADDAPAGPGRIGLTAPEGSDSDTTVNGDNSDDSSLAGDDTEVGTEGNSQDDDLVKTYTTDENGLIDLSNLKPGEYKISETNVPQGYEGLKGTFTLTVKEEEGKRTYKIDTKEDKVEFDEETNTITVENEKKVELKEVVIRKVDKDRNPLKGAEFTVEKEPEDEEPPAEDAPAGPGLATLQADDVGNPVAEEDDSLDGEEGQYITKENGEISLGNLEEGTYTITEVKAPEGYEKLEEDLILVISKSEKNGELEYTLSDGEVKEEDGKIILEIENKKSEETPGEGDGETPGEGDGETPGEGDGETPGEGDEETPGEGDGETPGEGDGETPGEGDGETPGEGDGETPGEGDGETPGEGDGETPGGEDEDKPGGEDEDKEEDKDKEDGKDKEDEKDKNDIPVENDRPADKDEEKPSNPVVPEDNDQDKDKDEEKPSEPILPEDNDENKKEVVIVDKNNKPVKPGQDYVIKDSNGKIVEEGIVDKDGKIVIENLPAGKYKVEGLEDDYLLVVTEDGDYIVSIVEHKNPDSVGNVSDDQDYAGDIDEEAGETSVGGVLPRTGQGTNLLVLFLGIILVSLGFYSLKKSY